MARMSIDDKVCRDPRITVLATMLGWSRRETLGCLIADVWAICYDQATPVISARIIDAAAGHEGFADAMIECELATRDRSGKVRVRGAKERVEYLDRKRRAGREGGLKSAEQRSKNPKHSSSTTPSTPQAASNPNTNPNPNPPAVPNPPATANTDPDSARPEVGGGRRRKPRSFEPTHDEQVTAMRVLGRLGTRNGIAYSGAKDHIELIVRRLRDGVTEADLRKIIGYCAVELEWQDDERNAKYLRPETLFGSKTHVKYLDPARVWFMKNGLTLDDPPQLEAVP